MGAAKPWGFIMAVAIIAKQEGRSAVGHPVLTAPPPQITLLHVLLEEIAQANLDVSC
jgi:hypothetical protein